MGLRSSGGRVRVGPGTLYAMLEKFEANDIISRTRTEGRKKWYIITEHGRRMLLDETARLRRMLKDGEEILG